MHFEPHHNFPVASGAFERIGRAGRGGGDSHRLLADYEIKPPDSAPETRCQANLNAYQPMPNFRSSDKLSSSLNASGTSVAKNTHSEGKKSGLRESSSSR